MLVDLLREDCAASKEDELLEEVSAGDWAPGRVGDGNSAQMAVLFKRVDAGVVSSDVFLS